MQNKSFTLIELLVVIVIIGILAGVIIVSVSSSINKANFAKAQSFSNTVQNELLGDLVSEWTFDSPAVANITEDTWGNKNGTVYGAATYKTKADGVCVYGGCYSFDGTDDYIDCGTSDILNISNEITISFWLNANSFGSNQGIISKMRYVSAINSQGYFIRFNSVGALGFNTQNNSLPNGFVSMSNLSLGRWYFIVTSFDSGVMKIYGDGVLVQKREEQTAPETTTSSFKIGSTYGISENFNGFIDDVRIYDTALSLSQIKQQYVAGLDSLLANGSIAKEEYTERLNSLAQK